jgi:hypothetical protein
MQRKLYFLFFVYLVSCGNPIREYKLDSPMVIDQVLNQSTEMMVHDVSNPPLATRFYAYVCLAGYQSLSAFEMQPKKWLDSLNGYSPFSGLIIKQADPGLSAVLSMAQVSAAIQPSGNIMREWIAKFRDSIVSAGCPEAVYDSSLKMADNISRHIIDYAKKDGYSKLTALPRFSPGKSPGQWYPTPPGYFPAVEPYFSRIRPFTIDTADLAQYEIPAPAPYSTEKGSLFYQSALAVFEADQQRTQRDIAAFWDCNPFALSENGHLLIGLKKISPGAHWMGIAGIAAQNLNLGFAESVQLRTVLSVCMMDAFWLCWREKYRTNRIRPETAIRKLIDPSWKPFLQTPPFPEYPSGHSVVSSAAAEVLTSLLGENIAYTDTVERRYGIPDRTYQSFQQAAAEASMSRFAGGIHFMDAIVNGQKLGKTLGNSGLRKLGYKQ